MVEESPAGQARTGRYPAVALAQRSLYRKRIPHEDSEAGDEYYTLSKIAGEEEAGLQEEAEV